MTSPYPADLPCPSSAPLQRAERRQLSSIRGPRGSRVTWTDQLASQSLSFVLKSERQVQRWRDWYEGDLLFGAAWFSASWPRPEGGVGVRRFVGAPVFSEYLPVIKGWRVLAEVQIRGRGLLPLNPPMNWLIGPDVDGQPNKWVLNPSNSNEATILGSNTYPTGPDTFDYVKNDLFSSRPISSGARYAEVYFVSESSGANNELGHIGLASGASRWMAAHPGYLTPSGDPLDPGHTVWATGRVVMFAYDASTGELWLGRDGVWFRSTTGSDPTTHVDPHYAGISGPVSILLHYFPAIANCVVVLRTSASDFQYSPPAGYIPWAD